MAQPLLCYVVNHAAFFVSHRLSIALAARASGYRVCLLIGQAGSEKMEVYAESELKKHNIEYYRTPFRAAGVNVFKELYALFKLTQKLRSIKPDLVHAVSPKGILYGGIASRLAGVDRAVFAVSGMGFLETKGRRSILRITLSVIYKILFRMAVRHTNRRFIVQNADDFESIVRRKGVNRVDVQLIAGSGVKIDAFPSVNWTHKTKTVLFPARLLRDKGVVEFIEAAKICAEQAPDWKFVLAGTDDYHNPTAISRAQIQEWVLHDNIEWLGHVENMVPVYMAASIVCLPSYREGMPKALLEAAVAGCAVVTTNTVGCREAIIENKTGYLVPVKNSTALAATLLQLINDDERRVSFGKCGKEMAIVKFGLDSVIRQTLTTYGELLAAK